MKWNKRSSDTQYNTVAEARQSATALADLSTESSLLLQDITPQYIKGEEGSEFVITFAKDARQRRSNEADVLELTPWAAEQLCGLTGAPYSWLKDRPAELVAAELTVDFKKRYPDKGVNAYYIPQNGHLGLLRAANGSRYARITNAAVLEQIDQFLDAGNGDWVPAHAWEGAPVSLGKAITLSDRDLWAFFINKNHPIEVAPGDTLYPGVVFGNSDVGSGSLNVQSFFFRSICANRNVMGIDQKDLGDRRARIRHVGRAEQRFLEEVMPAARQLAAAPTTKIAEVIRKSRDQEIADSISGVLDFLKDQGFGQLESKAALEYADREGLNPRSIYGAVQGLTAQYREINHNDSRIAKEAKASSLYERVSV